jgi:hypothetical protein
MVMLMVYVMLVIVALLVIGYSSYVTSSPAITSEKPQSPSRLSPTSSSLPS